MGQSRHAEQRSVYLRGQMPETPMFSLLPYKSEMNIFDNKLDDDLSVHSSISFDADYDDEFDEQYTPMSPLPFSDDEQDDNNSLYPDANLLMVSHASMYSANPDEM